MRFFIKSKLSENISETPEGFLLCRNVPLTHTGKLTYVHPEHPFGEKYSEVIITRQPEQLFSKQTMSSFEGKDFTIQHPEEFVNPENYQELTHGVLLNIRKGTEKIEVDGESVEVLLGDFLVKSAEAIKAVKGGMREVSLGYDATWVLVDEDKNIGEHQDIIGNHCALVDQGRAGINCAITDHKKEKTFMDVKEKFKKLFGKSVEDSIAEKEKEEKESKDAEEANTAKMIKDLQEKVKDLESKLAPEKKEESKDEEEEKKPVEKEEKEESKDEGDVESRLSKIESLLQKLLGSKDSEESEESEEVVADESEEEESEDNMEGIEDADEDKEDKKAKASDVVSKAEILSSGIKDSKDIKKKALEAAYKTVDGKKIIDTLTSNKGLSAINAQSEDAIFNAAVEMMKAKRVKDVAATKVQTIDNFPQLKMNSAMTPEKINQMNADFYNSANK